MKYSLYIFFIFFIFPSINKPHNKHKSKFEQKLSSCRNNIQTIHRPNDEELIYKCVDNKCFEELIQNETFILEFGEINNKFRKNMEKCYNNIAYDSLTKKRIINQ